MKNVKLKMSVPQSVMFSATWHAAIGVRYAFRPNWKVLTGVAYDSSPVKTRDRTPDMPLDRQWRVSIGFQHERSKDLNLGVAYEYVSLGDVDIDQAGRRVPHRQPQG